MAGTLNLYLDPEMSYTWRQVSLVFSKSQGHGVTHIRNIRPGSIDFSAWANPLHRYGHFQSCILEDEDFAQDIQLHLLEISKGGYVGAQDVVDYIERPDVQERLGKKTKISLRTAQKEEEWNVY